MTDAQQLSPANPDLILLEDTLWLLVQQTHNPAYDFAFDTSFACRRPWNRTEPVTAIARVGAPADYDALFAELADGGVTLVNIECNDAQESGYAGVSPFGLWNEVVRVLREG